MSPDSLRDIDGLDLLPIIPVEIQQSTFDFLPHGRLRGGFEFGFTQRPEANTFGVKCSKMQMAAAMISKWTEELHKRSAISQILDGNIELQRTSFNFVPDHRFVVGFRFGYTREVMEEAHSLTQTPGAMISEWNEKPGVGSALPRIADGHHKQGNPSEIEQVEDGRSGTSHSPETPESNDGSLPSSLIQDELAGFMESMIEQVRNAGIHVSMDFGDEDTEGIVHFSTPNSEITTAELAVFMERVIERAKQAGLTDSIDASDVNAKQGILIFEGLGRSFTNPQGNSSMALNGISSGESDEPLKDGTGSRSAALLRGRPVKAKLDPTSIKSTSGSRNAVDDLSAAMLKISLEDSGLKSAIRIKVPRGWKGSLTRSLEFHYNSVAFNKARTYRRQHSGEKRKRQNIGFKPHEVIGKGALHGAHLDVKCSLIGDIHPIFNEIYWTDCPSYIYEIMKPAFLLASKFLTTPQVMQHFQTVWNGDRQVCVETPARKNKPWPCYRITQDIPLTVDSGQELIQHIASFAGTINFQFLDASRGTVKADTTFASTDFTVPCIRRFITKTGSETRNVSMHHDFYTQAQKLSEMQYPDPAQVMRFHFFFAVNVLHEFAHVFEIARSPKQTALGQEVYMYDWLEAESGRAWETATFGGWLTAINDRCDTQNGLCVIEWPEPALKYPAQTGRLTAFPDPVFAHPDEAARTQIWTVSMDYIDALFQESTWEEILRQPVRRGVLHVPMNGARSLNVPSFSTARLEDLLKEREMGAMELALREATQEENMRSFSMSSNSCSMSFLSRNSIEGEDGNDGEDERVRKKRRMYVPAMWKKQMGRRGGLC